MSREKKARDPKFLWNYAQALYFVGRRDESAQAYRACLTIDPSLGEAYWGLAELQGDALTAADIPMMRAHLIATTLEPSSRRAMQFALGHALQRAGDYAGSFAAYHKGAALSREIAITGPADAKTPIERVRRRHDVFTFANMASRGMSPRTPQPIPADPATPIFLVGMPRAGLTLVEQILASHSQVEAAIALPVKDDLIRDLVYERGLKGSDYPACVLDLPPARLAELGADYLARAGAFRELGKPFFIDRWPWNWLDIGLISLILPQAKIIDVRREPMASCFAMFRQILPGDAEFSNDLGELGRYYNAYADLMRHWNEVLPGRVHGLSYERLVDDTETEIRALLDHCGLDFEPACLRFWETERSIVAPGAAAVRRPIFRDSLEQWRHFEPWLGPLAAALEGAAKESASF